MIHPLNTSWTGAPLGGLPGTDPRRCPAHTRIPGSQLYSSIITGWEWDYWVEGGSWVLWDGFDSRAYFTGKDANGLVVPLINWSLVERVRARVYWTCEPILPGAQAAGGVGARTAANGASLPAHGIGDAGDNSLRGGTGESALRGLGGDDRLAGGASDDQLHGGSGHYDLSGGDHDDYIHGARGGDRAVGGSGEDDILTGKGADVSHGGRHGDQLFDDEGRDRLRGGPGNDRFSAHDGDRDLIDCGSGEDIAFADGEDVVRNCEHVYRSRRETPKKLPNV